MAKKIVFELSATDAGLTKRIQELRDKLKEVNKELRSGAVKEGDDRFKELAREVGKAKTEIADLTGKQRALNREFKSLTVPSSSLAGLRIEYARLSDQISRLTALERQSTFGQNLIKQAAAVKRQVDGLEQSIGRYTGNVGNYRSAFAGLAGTLAGLAGSFSVAFAAQEILNRNKVISDSIANVAKTTGLTIEQVDVLADRLKFRDTRTNLADQLNIAQIGGQLGIATDQIEAFTESTDVLNVALGDQFADVDDLTRRVAGLRNVLTDFRTENVSDDLLKIGNALNVLETQGPATAGAIAEFASRISGAAVPLGVTTDQVFGLSTALAELSINPERGATAVNRLLNLLARTPEQFAKSLNVPVDQFTKLVKTDLVGALALVSEKVAQGAGSNVEFAQILDDLDISAQGAIEVFGKLGGNIDLLRQRTTTAGAALKSTDSLYAEFEKKNNNLAASVEKLNNAFTALVQGDKVSGFFQAIFDGLTFFVIELAKSIELLGDWSFATDGATFAIEAYEDGLLQANIQIAKESVSLEKNIAILGNEKASRDQRNKAIGELLKQYPELLKQQELEGAGAEQLAFIQVKLTSALREQIVERQRLRAKEAVEAELISRQLRQVELEATPDRALLGSLTAGETVRNFGVINTQELRKRLTAQFDGDIKALEDQLKTIDERFNTVGRRFAAAAEQGLTADQQDLLDAQRQYAEVTGETIKKVEATTEAVADNTKKSLDNVKASAEKTKEQEKLLAGSLAFLRAEVARLKEEIEKLPGDTEKFTDKIKELAATEKDLAALENRLAFLLSDTIPDPNKVLQPFNLLLEQLGSKSVNVDLFGGEEQAKKYEKAFATSDADLQALRKKSDEETEKERAEAIGRMNALAQKGIQENREKELKAIEDAEERRRRMLEDLINGGIRVAQTLAQNIFGFQRNELEERTRLETEALDASYQKRIADAQGNAKLEKKLAADLAAEKAKIEKQAARERQQIAIKEAIIQGALSVIQALPNFILAGAIAAATAIQVAFIKKQTFAGGGQKNRSDFQYYPERFVSNLKDFQRGGHTGTGTVTDGTGHKVAGRIGQDAVVHDGEYVIPKWLVSQRREIVTMLERERLTGRRAFAAGGVVGVQVVPNTPSSTQAIYVTAAAGFTAQQVEQLGTIVGDIVAQKTGQSVQQGVVVGLDTTNRLAERQNALNQNRQQ